MQNLHVVHVIPSPIQWTWTVVLGDNLGVPAAAEVRRYSGGTVGVVYHQEVGEHLRAYVDLACSLVRGATSHKEVFKVTVQCQGR